MSLSSASNFSPVQGAKGDADIASNQGAQNGSTPMNSESKSALHRPSPFAKSGAFFLAGSIGAIVAATATSPLDVLRTRLQSDYYQSHLVASRLARGVADPSKLPFTRAAGLHIRETFQILFTIPRVEGWRALFKGLGANLVAIVPARGIHFYAYGNSKKLITENLTDGKEGPLVHLASAGLTGVITGTATNPIWVIKTRLQLDKSLAAGGAGRKYKNALDCLFQTVRAEGIRGLYRGLSASFLGISESSMQWVMYEESKRRLRLRQARIAESGRERTWTDNFLGSFGDSVAAGGAKFVAAFITYPHEVVRTRLRQTPKDGVHKYTGLIQCFRLIFKEEGLAGLYGGLTAHMLRVVPNAAIMFGTYEAMLHLLDDDTTKI